MKKVIFALVFVFFTGTFVNASSNTLEDNYVDCDEYASVTQGISLLAGFSYEESLNVFINAYDACVGYNLANLVEIEEEEIDWDE